MGQSIWAWGCALFLALTIGGHAVAQKAGDPFAATSEPGRLGPGAPTANITEDARQRIERVLNQPLKETLDFTEQPLRDVATILSQTYDIPILFDTNALDAVAASPDVEVSVQIANVTLRSALDLMLKNAGAEELTYMIDDEVLLITTQEETASRLETRVYRVDDLPGVIPPPPTGGRVSWADFHILIDAIQRGVEPRSWRENGTGNGDISSMEPGILIIRQTARIHEQVEQILAELRRVRVAIDADAAKRRSALADRPVTKGIHITDAVATNTEEDRELIRDLIKKSVDWEPTGDLSEEDIFFEVVPNRIFVRHLPRVVQQVEGVTAAMQLVSPFICGGVGGGGYGGVAPSVNKPGLAEPVKPSEDSGKRNRGGGMF
ncbi:MAG: STN domain-containing protein [Pirellulales bacterium]|nr:STN domain-containing protein [Pirellulales bacterium]